MDNRELRSKVFSGFFWKFGERITAQIITLVVSIVLARLLEPSDYGVVALVMIFITIANVFVSNGLGSALIQKEDADNVDFSSVFYCNIALSVVLYFIIFILAPFFADFFEEPLLSPALRVLGIRIIVAAVNSIQQAYVSRQMLFKKFFLSTLFGTIVSGIVGIAMAYSGYGVWALVAQYLTNTCIDTIVLQITVRWKPDLVFSWSRTKKLFSYGWKLLVSGLIDVGYNQLRSFVIGKKYSSEDLAFYNQAERYPSIFVTNVNASISSVIFPAMSQVQADIGRVRQMTRRAIQISSYIMWPLMIGLFVVAEPLVKVVLTEKWLPCVPYIQVFCISYGFWPIHTANLQAMNALGRSDLFLKLEIIKKVFGLCVLFISIPIGPFAIAVSMLISSIVSTVVNSFPNIKILNYGIIDQIKDIMPTLLVSTLMGLIVLPLKFVIGNDYVLLIAQFLIGGSVYAVFSKVFHLYGFAYLLDIVKAVFTRKKTKE